MISILLLLLGAILPWCSHGEHHLIYKGEGKVGVTSEIKHHSLDGYELVKTHLSTNPDITIGVNSTVLSYSGEWFTVTWSGVADPQVMAMSALFLWFYLVPHALCMQAQSSTFWGVGRTACNHLLVFLVTCSWCGAHGCTQHTTDTRLLTKP